MSNTDQKCRLTPEQVRAYVGLRSYNRGESYWRSGRVRDTRVEGDAITARCIGNASDPYRIRARVCPEGIVSAYCDCPVGSGGRCKHVAAVLLAWLDEPGGFVPVESLQQRLKALSKEQLAKVIATMLEHSPELEWALNTVNVTGNPGDANALFNRFYQMALDVVPNDMDWGATAQVACGLERLLDIATEFEAAGNPVGAAALYHGVLTATLECYHFLHDEGDISSIILDCTHGIASNLGDPDPDSQHRHDLLDGLFPVLALDTEMGGIGLSDPIPTLLADHATEEERSDFAGHIRKLLASKGESQEDTFSEYRRAHLGRLLLELETGAMDDEAYLAVCRETGRHHDLVDRLLDLKRCDEAVAAARELDSDYRLLTLAEVFIRHDAVKTFEHLLEARSDTTSDTRVWEWLGERYRATGRVRQALDMAKRAFYSRPSLDRYINVRDIATEAGCREEARAELLRELASNDHGDVLIDVRLDENDVPAALQLLEHHRTKGGYRRRHKELEVAAAAENDYPLEAVKIYQRKVSGLINQRGRNSYAEAARHAATIRRLLHDAGQEASWHNYINALKTRMKSLPACKDEMHKAGVL